jgi:hypothetical protein
MKVLLMHPERDFDAKAPLSDLALSIEQDLGLTVLLEAMACGDRFLFDLSRVALLSSVAEPETLLHRQAVLTDCLTNPEVVGELYDIALRALDRRLHPYVGFIDRYPSGILSTSVQLLRMLLERLREVRGVVDADDMRFRSSGFRNLFSTLKTELSDAYLGAVQSHLKILEFRSGVLISAELGKGNEVTNHTLRVLKDRRPSWLKRIVGDAVGATIWIHERDEAGARALSELRDHGLNQVANAAAQSAQHVLKFFEALRNELGFYVACLNLHGALAAARVPTSMPRPEGIASGVLSFEELHDPCLALRLGHRTVGNSVTLSGKGLIVITGANQGGKSTFLRSIGLAQLMMQAGMFVAAESFQAEVCVGLFTHFKRAEDATMRQGKLDEELSRMSSIADAIEPNAMLLLNESFASTNDREGSEIATHVVRALREKQIKVLFVTHLYPFARSCFESHSGDAVFLQPERSQDGSRSFRLVQGQPTETSYGEDLYREVFTARAVDSR